MSAKAPLFDEYNRIMNLKGVTKNQKKGILLESALHIALSKLKIPHENNPFDERYAQSEGQGIDNVIPTKKGLIGIECKNNNGNYDMTPHWSQREITSRFKETECIIKILICSFLTMSQKTIKTLKSKSFWLIELCFQITNFESYKKAIHKLIQKTYRIKKNFNFHSLPRKRPMSVLNYLNREKCKYTSTSLLSYMSNSILNNENNRLKIKNTLIT